MIYLQIRQSSINIPVNMNLKWILNLTLVKILLILNCIHEFYFSGLD